MGASRIGQVIRIFTVLFMLVAGLGSVLTENAKAEEAWQLLKPDGLGFSIEMPEAPNAQEEDIDLGDGTSAKMRTFQIISQNVIYDITVADYPSGAIQAAGGDAQALDNARDGILRQAMGQLKSDTKIVFADRPTRELLIDMTMDMTARSRIFIVGDRLFNVGVITRNGNERSASVERYFASFKLADGRKP